MLVLVLTLERQRPAKLFPRLNWFFGGPTFGVNRKRPSRRTAFDPRSSLTVTACPTASFRWDHIGLFLKDLGNKFSSKSSQNISLLLGIFWQTCLFKKTLFMATFWATFRNVGLFLLQHMVTLFFIYSLDSLTTWKRFDGHDGHFKSNLFDFEQDF